MRLSQEVRLYEELLALSNISLKSKSVCYFCLAWIFALSSHHWTVAVFNVMLFNGVSMS